MSDSTLSPDVRPRDVAVVERAVYSAVAHGNWMGAAQLVAANWGALVSRNVTLVELVASSLPERAYADEPVWVVAREYARMLRLPPSVRPVVYPDLAPGPTSDMSAANRMVLWTSRAVGMRTVGRLAEAMDFDERAREAAREAARSRADPWLQGVLPSVTYQWALTSEFGGRLESAVEFLRESLIAAERVGDIRTALNALGELAWLCALEGRGQAADEHLAAFDELRAAYQSATPPQSSVEIARSIRHWDCLDFDVARGIIAGADVYASDEHALFIAGGWVMLNARTSAEVGISMLSKFDAIVAADAARRTTAPFINQHNLIVRSEVLMLQGQAAAAIRMIAPDEAQPELYVAARLAIANLLVGNGLQAGACAEQVLRSDFAWPRLRAEAQLVLAALALRRGSAAQARELFAGAVAIATKEDIFMPFAMLPKADLQQLATLVSAEGLPPQFARLLDGGILSPPGDQRLVVLTAQETRLVRLLDEDRDERELAQLLGVGRSTLRTHLRAVYRKLQVNDRRAVRAAAHAQGLL